MLATHSCTRRAYRALMALGLRQAATANSFVWSVTQLAMEVIAKHPEEAEFVADLPRALSQSAQARPSIPRSASCVPRVLDRFPPKASD